MWHDLHFSHHGHKLLCGDTQAAGATHAELEYTRTQAFRNNPSKYHLIIKDVDCLKAPEVAVGSKVLPCMVFYHLTSFVVWRVTFGFFYFIFFSLAHIYTVKNDWIHYASSCISCTSYTFNLSQLAFHIHSLTTSFLFPIYLHDCFRLLNLLITYQMYSWQRCFVGCLFPLLIIFSRGEWVLEGIFNYVHYL